MPGVLRLYKDLALPTLATGSAADLRNQLKGPL